VDLKFGLSLKEEQRMTVFENRVLRKIFGNRRDKIAMDCITYPKLHLILQRWLNKDGWDW
jgi:hypothetical protein